MVEAVAKTADGSTLLEPMASQVIKARQNLNKVLQAKTASKVSLYEHIIKVVDQIVQTCPDRAIERFEEISYLIKNAGIIQLDDFVKCVDQRPYAQHCSDTA